ncbi:lysogenic conversion protein, partial [Vibrio cholerae]|nr:lysogenic conversion protein [Vibrio cholerae]
KFNKIDSGSSTHKERTLFEKLDRSKELVLKSGVQDHARTIGSYILGGVLSEGLSDCAKFLLMPKNKFWNNKLS